MSTTIIINATSKRAKLTTEHARSSYGQPVIVAGTSVYGPGDQIVGSWIYIRAAKLGIPMGQSAAILNWNDAVRKLELASDRKRDAEFVAAHPARTISLRDVPNA